MTPRSGFPVTTSPWLMAVILADVTSFGIVMPLLASYAAAYSASTAAIGVLVATYSGMHFLLAPMWGRWSDRVGRRPVLLVGLTGTLISSLVFAAADNFLGLLVSRLLAGGLGATLNVAQAYAADQSEPEARTRVMGLVGAAFGFGFILGPTIGGLTSRLGPAAPGLAAAGVAALALAAAVIRLPEPSRHRPAFSEPAVVSGWRPYAVPFAAAIGSTLAFTVLYVVFPLHAERALGFDRSAVSYHFALVGLVTAIVQGGLVGRLARRFGEGRLLAAGGVLMAAGLAALSRTVSAGAGEFYPALVALGAGYGLAGPAEAGYVSRLAPAAVQGRVLGALQSANSVARVLGPVAAGVGMGLGGAPAAFIGAAGCAGLAGVLGVVLGLDKTDRSRIG